MTDIRKEVDYDGLKVSITTERKDEFFFTGDEPEFVLTVRNDGPVRRTGRLFLTWNLVGQYVNDTTYRPVDFDLDAGEAKPFNLEKEWFSNPGRAAYRLWVFAKPEAMAAMSASQLGAGITATPFQHPLVAFNIEDKGTYEADREERRRLQTHATYSLVFSTIAMVVATIIAGVLAYIHG